jgi:hypothetical protein
MSEETKGDEFVRATDPEAAKALLAEAWKSVEYAAHQAVLLMHDAGYASPVGAAADLFAHVIVSLGDTMRHDVIRRGMLIAYEASHAKPMSFVEINEAKSFLVVKSGERRTRMGIPSIIIPGGKI